MINNLLIKLGFRQSKFDKDFVDKVTKSIGKRPNSLIFYEGYKSVAISGYLISQDGSILAPYEPKMTRAQKNYFKSIVRPILEGEKRKLLIF